MNATRFLTEITSGRWYTVKELTKLAVTSELNIHRLLTILKTRGLVICEEVVEVPRRRGAIPLRYRWAERIDAARLDFLLHNPRTGESNDEVD